jgi:hypothetical protein
MTLDGWYRPDLIEQARERQEATARRLAAEGYIPPPLPVCARRGCSLHAAGVLVFHTPPEEGNIDILTAPACLKHAEPIREHFRDACPSRWEPFLDLQVIRPGVVDPYREAQP